MGLDTIQVDALKEYYTLLNEFVSAISSRRATANHRGSDGKFVSR